MKLTSDQKKRLEVQLSEYANENIEIDDTSSTGVVYAFVSELSKFRIADKMKNMTNFKSGFSESSNSFYVSIDLSN